MIDIVFDGPPGPEAGRFVEVESPPGVSVGVGEWIKRDDGYWVLRFDPNTTLRAINKELVGALEEADRQLTYLHEKFTGTGSGAAVQTRIAAVLARAKEQS